MRLSGLNLFAVLFLAGGVFFAFTVGVIRWADAFHESAKPAAIASVPADLMPAAIAFPATPELFPTQTPAISAINAPVHPTATLTLTPVPPTATATYIPPTAPPTATQIPQPTRTPMRTVYYTVKPGDNLTRIAARFGTTLDAIRRANNLPSTLIYAGQVLVIPAR